MRELPKPVTCDSAFATSLDVTRDTVAEIVACARARWTIENESFNVLKSNGCHLEHNFGHGKHNLAMTFAALSLFAFALQTVCDCLERLWIEATLPTAASRPPRPPSSHFIRPATARYHHGLPVPG